MTSLRKMVINIWLPILVLVAWEIISRSLTNLFFPAPSRLFSRLVEVIDADWVSYYFIPTLRTFFLGYGIGVFLGILTGALLGSSEKAYKYLMPSVVFVRKTPSVVKVPILLSLFGVSFTSQLLVVIIPVAFILMVVAAKATHDTSRVISDTSRMFRLSRFQAIFGLFLPAKGDEIFASAKAAIQVALVITILSEMLLGRFGLGVFTLTAKDLFDPELMWVGIIVVGLIGFVLHEVFQLLENRIRKSMFQSTVRK